jgi:hypothetical protein
MKEIIFGVAVSLSLTGATALAENNSMSACSPILTEAGRNVNLNESSAEYLNTIFDRYCEQSGTTKQSGFSLGVSAPIESIPVSLTLGSTDATSAMKNFCHNYASTANSRVQQRSYASTVVDKALATYVECVRIASTGNFIKHDILNDQTANVTITAASGTKLTIKGVKEVPSSNVKCSANTGPNTETNFIQKTRYDMDGTLTLACTREGANQSGTMIFPEATITVATNIGSYAFLWPKSAQLPINDANMIQSRIITLSQTIENSNQQISALQQNMQIISNGLKVGPLKICRFIAWPSHAWADTTVMPSGASRQACENWAISITDRNTAGWQMGCVNDTKVSWGGQSTPGQIQVPGDNFCGW